MEFKVGDVVKVIDNTGSLEGCGIEIGAVGEVAKCANYSNQFSHIFIRIDGRMLIVCANEIELVVRGLN